MTGPGLFSTTEKEDLRSRQLPAATAKPGLGDLQGCLLFGAGILARQILEQMRRHGLEPAWIVVSDPGRHGDRLMGVPIRGLDTLPEAGNRLVVVASTYLQEMAAAITGAGVRNWAWCWDIEAIFGRLAVPADAGIAAGPEVDRLAGLLSPGSREVLKGALAFRVTGDLADLPPVSPDQYFPPDLVPAACLTRLADCGAFTGDTLQDWWPRLAPQALATLDYHGIEPDPDNFARLRETCDGLARTWGSGVRGRLHLHPVAVGSAPGRIRMAQGDSGSVVTRTATRGPEVEVVRLDDLLAGQTLTALKMDLEGYEPDALEGARGLLRSQRPALLIAVYHRPEHLWQIPLWIHDLGLGYRLHLRHHAPSFAETVCYAIPEAP